MGGEGGGLQLLLMRGTPAAKGVGGVVFLTCASFACAKLPFSDRGSERFELGIVYEYLPECLSIGIHGRCCCV